MQMYVLTLRQICNYANRHTDVHIKHFQICSHTHMIIQKHHVKVPFCYIPLNSLKLSFSGV